jgi:hypothetical protein
MSGLWWLHHEPLLLQKARARAVSNKPEGITCITSA